MVTTQLLVQKPPHPAYPGRDRRRSSRYIGEGIALSISGRPSALLDISEGGLRAAAPWLTKSGTVTVVMEVADGTRMEALAEVKAVDSAGASLSFANPTYPLMRFIVHYLADHHGVDPHIFR